MSTNLKGHCQKPILQQFRTIVEHACFSRTSSLRVARTKADERLQTRSISVRSVTRVDSERARFFTPCGCNCACSSNQGCAEPCAGAAPSGKRAHPSRAR
eukprot:6192304-Pleurochrysis_carterae.AAC.1